jgi:hypothetical protein
MPEPPTHVHRTLRRGLLAGTELQFDKPIEQSASLGNDDASLVSVFLKDIVDHECWYNGRPLPVETWDAGETYASLCPGRWRRTFLPSTDDPGN